MLLTSDAIRFLVVDRLPRIHKIADRIKLNNISLGVNSLYKFIYFILYMTLTCNLPTLNKELIIIISLLSHEIV